MESIVETIDTLIIGAGPAGLTTAYRLAKAGQNVAVIEQDKDYVGGASCLILEATVSSQSRARSLSYGTRFSRTISSRAKGCRAFITAVDSTPTP